MRINILLLLVCAAMLSAADSEAEKRLVETAQNSDGPKLRSALEKHLGAEALKDGAHVSYRPDFVFAIRSASEPSLFVDDRPAAGKARRVDQSDLWIQLAKLQTGRSHAFQFQADGERIGLRRDVRTYSKDHYPQAGVRQGKLSQKQAHVSKIFPGMKSDWWYYASPGVNPAKPATLMVWQDGQKYAHRNSRSRLLTVVDNLEAQGKIPPMVLVMIAPGYVGKRRMRSVEYDTTTDRYIRFVSDEILPEVEKKYKLRADGYSRSIGGESSGGICALNAAWQQPKNFARVISRIGSYTAIAWRSGDEKGADVLDGGQFFPSLVRKAEKRNIRIWMEDGSSDLENDHGSWPLQNIQLANSLKMRDYDFKFTFGNAQHSSANGDSKLPEALTWLWRGYDAAKTEQTFDADPAEKGKPYFRVVSLNRHE